MERETLQKDNRLQIPPKNQRKGIRRGKGRAQRREAHDVDNEDDGPDCSLDDGEHEVGAWVQAAAGEEGDFGEEKEGAD